MNIVRKVRHPHPYALVPGRSPAELVDLHKTTEESVVAPRLVVPTANQYAISGARY